MDPVEQVLLDLGTQLLGLFEVSRTAHGIYQGSHEAALFEAQGGVIGPGQLDHLGSVVQSATALQRRYNAANLALNRLNGLDTALGLRVRATCEPVLRLAGDYIRTATETRDAANMLRQTNPTRFQGVVVGRGGLGLGIERTPQALVSNQLNAMSGQLTARGIEPRLVPAAQSSLEPTLARIRQLPINGRETAVKLSAALAAMRAMLTQTLARASLVGRARLTAALLGLESAIVGFGSRLTTPVLVDMNVIRQILGVPRIDT